MIAITVTIIGAIFAVAGYFVKRYIDSRDDEKQMITNLCESVASITAKQEGQLSFARALLDQQDKISKIDMKLDAFHIRLDDIFDIVKGLMK